jgi:cysteine desulfurase
MREVPPAPIYLDHNATAPLRPEVFDAMLPFLAGPAANASSRCRPGRDAAAAIGRAREEAAALLGCSPGEIVFTSGGTESNNAAIRSALSLAPDRRHLVSSPVEHSAVRNLLLSLERSGYEVTWVGVGSGGEIDPAEFAAAIRPDTALATAMAANNETGVLFPVAALAAAARERGVPFHTDAVQAAGKIPLDLAATGPCSAAVAAHKFGGPQGIGALHVSRRTRFAPQLVGGAQESGRRAGTEPVAAIVGMGAACRLAAAELAGAAGRMAHLRDRLEELLFAALPGIARNGTPRARLPNTSNLRFPGTPAETLLILLDQAGLCVSAGSACTAGSPAPSHVLKAMGLSDAEAKASLRFSLGPTTSEAEIDAAADRVIRAARKIAATP